MKNAESFIVWAGNVYGDWDRCLDIWTDVFRTRSMETEKDKTVWKIILIILLIFYSIFILRIHI